MLGAILLVARIAAAEDRASSARLELVKQPGAEACIAQGALVHAVEVRLRRAAFRPDLPATLHVKIDIGHSAGTWSAALTMRDGSGALLGQRSIVSDAMHCSALDDSLALVVALLVDAPPSAPIDEPTPTPAPQKKTPTPTPDVTQRETVIELPRETLAPREPWQFEADLTGSATLGALPGVVPGVELGIVAKPPRILELRLFAGWDAPREERRSGGGAGARFTDSFVGLELCPLAATSRAVQWFGCVGQTLGRLRAAAFGFDENTSAARLTYALSASTGLKVRLVSRIAARLAIRTEVPLAREVFIYGARDGSEPHLFAMKPITAVLDLGLIVRL